MIVSSLPQTKPTRHLVNLKSGLILFCLFCVVCFSFGYATLNRYNPANVNGLYDSQDYFAMMRFDYASADPPYKFRVFVPTLAGMLLPFFTRFHPETWNPATLSLLITASVLLSMSALLLVAFAARIGCSAFAAVLAPFIFLTCFPVVNDYCCGLIDSGEVLCLLCFLNAVAARKWSLIPAIVAVGALAKETGLLFMITFLAVYWIIGYLSRKEMKNPAVSCGASSHP